eukprot:4375182-Amphidinium_carterae.1
MTYYVQNVMFLRQVTLSRARIHSHAKGVHANEPAELKRSWKSCLSTKVLPGSTPATGALKLLSHITNDFWSRSCHTQCLCQSLSCWMTQIDMNFKSSSFSPADRTTWGVCAFCISGLSGCNASGSSSAASGNSSSSLASKG